MNCMKCGREIDSNQAFCPICLELMAKCPVKADVVVQLPNHQETLPKKVAPRKRGPTPEEQVQKLKKANRWLVGAVVVLLCISTVLTFLSIDVLRELDVQRFLGQNYSTVETTK